MTFIEKAQEVLRYLKAELDAVEEAVRAYTALKGDAERPSGPEAAARPSRRAAVVKARKARAKVQRSEAVERVVDAVRATGGAASFTEIQKALACDKSQVSRLIGYAVGAGRVVKGAGRRGKYRLDGEQRARKPARKPGTSSARARLGRTAPARELTRAVVAYAVSRFPDAVRMVDVERALGRKQSTVASALRRAVEAGKLWQPVRGRYKAKAVEAAKAERAKPADAAVKVAAPTNGRELLLAVLSAYGGDDVPAAAVVDYFERSGRSGQSAYQALSDAVRQGTLERTRSGHYRVVVKPEAGETPTVHDYDAMRSADGAL